MPTRPMSFVLVHGACHGAWCWTRVTADLRARGHHVFVPTLSGTGERVHLATPAIGLDTMVQDVVAVLDAEELEDVVLVGHSFGAVVCLGVADVAAHRLRRVVLLDGIVVEPGRCALDSLPADLAATRHAEAVARGARINPLPAAAYGVVDPGDQAWVDRHLTTHPLRSYTDVLSLLHAPGNGRPVTYIACTDPPYEALTSSLANARRWAWPVTQLATGHDAMITAPAALSDLLVDVAQ